MNDADLHLLGLCQHGQELELGNAILAAAEAGQELQFIQDTLVQRLSGGLVLRDEVIARVLASAPHREMWNLTWPRLEKNPRTILILFDAGYPSIEVEAALCTCLFERLKSGSIDDVPRLIFEAFREKGTKSVLPTLYAVLKEIEPGATAASHFGSMLGVVEGLEAAWRVEMAELARGAIRAISGRSETGGAAQPSFDRVPAKDAAEKALSKARRYEELDPEVSAQYSRKSAEALAKWWYRAYGLEQSGGKPANQMMLGALIDALTKAGATPLFVKLLSSCAPLGNFASHDQGEASGKITAGMASNLISLVEQALRFDPQQQPLQN